MARVAEGINQIIRELNVAFPNRPKPDWTWADSNHSISSDHSPKNPKHYGVVTAIDIRSAEVAQAVSNNLRASRDNRIKYVIFNNRMFSSYDHANGPAWVWRSYSGSNPHRDHVHVSLQDAAHYYDNDKPFGIVDIIGEKEEDMLQKGDEGSYVRFWQRQLQWYGKNVAGAKYLPEYGADKDFGEETEKFTLAFQTREGLPKTGKVTMFEEAMMRQIIHEKRNVHGATSGLSETDADKRYVRKGTTIKLS